MENETSELQMVGLISTLRERFESLNNKHVFSPGDIVQQKAGLDIKVASGALIVISILDEPIIDSEHDSGSPYFRNKLDIICGTISGDGELLCLHFESNRLEPYTGPMSIDELKSEPEDLDDRPF